MTAGDHIDFSSLHHDILVCILEFLSSADALALAATSKTNYPVAKDHALRVVTLTTLPQVSQFTAFMLADPSNRTHKLQCLTLHIPKAIRIVSQRQVLDLLRQAVHLKSLTISSDSQMIADISSLDILGAVAGLPNLVHLEFNGSSRLTIRLGDQLKGKLRRLTLNFPYAFLHLDTTTVTLPLLSNISGLTKLESLRLKHFCAQSETIMRSLEPASAHADYPTWPTVHSLELSACSAPLGAFVSAFPNVRVLRMRSMGRGVSASSVDHGTARWRHLDDAAGIPADFAYWRLACPVHCLRLLQASSHSASLATNAVAETSPVALQLHLKYIYEDDSQWTALLDASPRLRLLDLATTIPRKYAWKQILRLVRHLGLVCLRIRVKYVSDRDSEGSARERSNILSAITNTAERDELLAAVACDLPTLRFIALAVDQHAGTVDADDVARIEREFSWWRRSLCNAESPSRSWIPMSPVVGAHIYDFMCSPKYSPELDFDEISLAQPCPAESQALQMFAVDYNTYAD